MKIYTQTGDQGKTSLLSGERVSKSHVRVDAFGEVDELNAALGVLGACLPDETILSAAAQLTAIQSDLFHLGALLAAAPGSPVSGLKAFDEKPCRRLEGLIDAMEAGLPELTSFILPGGHPAAAQAHLACTICRRAERALSRLIETSDSPDAPDNSTAAIQAYLNRLSDYLFVLARHINHRTGGGDVIWQVQTGS